MARAFGVDSVPQTVLIGPDGALAAVTRPDDLDAALIARVAAGERVTDDAPLPPADPADPDPLFKLVVRPAGNPGSGEPGWSAKYRGELPDRSAADLLAFAFAPDDPPPPADPPAGRFDLSYRFPPTLSEAARAATLRAAVTAALAE